MRICILGATGMLGHQLMIRLSPKFDVTGCVRTMPDFPQLQGYSLKEGVEAGDFATVEKTLRETAPDVVINCIGVVKQRDEARSPLPSITINSLFPHRLADLCEAVGARLVHISTDCIFRGDKGAPYGENDPSDATDLYGRSKFLGEIGGENCPARPHVVTLRTSIIGPELKNKQSLFEWFAGNRGGSVKGFVNALYTGFTTIEMARIIEMLIAKYPRLCGLYQVASEAINKYDLLNLINQAGNFETTIARDEEFTCDRRLDGSRFNRETGYNPPAWSQMIEELCQIYSAEYLIDPALKAHGTGG